MICFLSFPKSFWTVLVFTLMGKSAAVFFMKSFVLCSLCNTINECNNKQNAFFIRVCFLIKFFFAFIDAFQPMKRTPCTCWGYLISTKKKLTEFWSFLYILFHPQILDIFYGTCTLINDLIWNKKFAILTTFSDGFLATKPPQMLTLTRFSLTFKRLIFCMLSKTKIISLHIYYSVSVKCFYYF